MFYESGIDPEVKNLKNYFNSDETERFLLRNPKLVASGYLMDSPEWSSSPHVHDCTEILFCTAGKGCTTIYGDEHDIEAGDLIVYKPNTPHHEVSDFNFPLEFFFVEVTDFQINGLPENVIVNEGNVCIQKTGQYKEQFDTFFLELLRETLYRKVHYKNISETICACIVALVIRAMDNNTAKSANVSPHSIRIKEYIDNNFTSDLNLSQLSSAVYISQTYISHIFKADMGVSPMQYLINKRIAYAKKLLSTGDMPIAQIALKCGYDDPVYFSQMFKRMIGESPTKYRVSHKHEA